MSNRGKLTTFLRRPSAASGSYDSENCHRGSIGSNGCGAMSSGYLAQQLQLTEQLQCFDKCLSMWVTELLLRFGADIVVR